MWLEGGAPRPMARWVGILSPMVVGEPTKDEVPLLVHDGDWAVTRTVSFAGATGQLTLSPDGWTRLGAPFVPERLPACDAKAGGARFRVRGNHHGTASLDATADEGKAEALFEVRITGNVACVAGVSRRVGGAFVRADVAGGRGEGGALQGEKGAAEMRELACGWVERP